MKTDTQPTAAPKPVGNTISADGFIFVPADEMCMLLEDAGALTDWNAFTKSWDDLAVDQYMADLGRYRKRRYGVYKASGEKITRAEHQPHYQSLDYNSLNGGVERWFEPIKDDIGCGPCMTTILDFCCDLFGSRSPGTRNWHIEAHQFRIEAQAGEAGKPTPEGMHQDGRDYVLVLLIRRENIKSGTTTISDLSKKELGSFTLASPFDAALVDDARVYHGVTAVEPVNPALPAYRDVLVVTFKAE